MAPVKERPPPRDDGGPAAAADSPLEAPRENGGERCAGDESAAVPREETAEPPEGGWGWLVMLAAMWCNGAVFGIQNSCGVLFVSMLQLFGGGQDEQMAFKTDSDVKTRFKIGNLECERLEDGLNNKSDLQTVLFIGSEQ